MKEIVLDLMCELSDMEINDRAQQLSSTLQRYDEIEIEKKNSAKQYADLLGELGGQTRKLSGIIRRRAESRPVMCAVAFHSPAAGSKRIIRKDTGEIVKEEAMSHAEMQNNLFEERDASPSPDVTLPLVESALEESAKDDELFDDAVAIVFEFGKATSSCLQRRLRIGYGRAIGLLEAMERKGLIGPVDGSKPREILPDAKKIHKESRNSA